MTLDDIRQARSSHMAKKGTLPTKLNIPVCDAVKLLTHMVGNGSLPRDMHERATEAVKSKEKTMEFFVGSKIFGMDVQLIDTVE